ncbi:hypothetical protein PV328_011712 [Microctonus aethiopoides]|uniref:Uncharacterized protein n=1 Tax=Microctonus aethiopoides TaxID=144406 RepID=A0AA39C3L5_9HYME|nr:hypothetical protein PV328_011712 [Microctonus aethiopoides]
MTALGDGGIAEDVLRIRWLALLPRQVQRCLKVIRPQPSLREQAELADELLEDQASSPVMSVEAVSHRSRSPGPLPPDIVMASLTRELSDLKQGISEMATLTRRMPTPKINTSPATITVKVEDAAEIVPRQDLHRFRNQETAIITAGLGQTPEAVSNPASSAQPRKTNSAVDNPGG